MGILVYIYLTNYMTPCLTALNNDSIYTGFFSFRCLLKTADLLIYKKV
jgi:hypothetical protein